MSALVSDVRLGELIAGLDTLAKPDLEELRSLLLELRDLRSKTGQANDSHMRLARALDTIRRTAGNALELETKR